MEEKKETLKAMWEEGVLIVTPNENDDGVVLIGGEQSQAFKLKQPARPKDMHERVNQSLLTLKKALQQFKEAHGAEKAPDDLMLARLCQRHLFDEETRISRFVNEFLRAWEDTMELAIERTVERRMAAKKGK